MTSKNHNHYRPHHQHHMTKILFVCTFLILNIIAPCSSSNSSKWSVDMVRSPESTIAPLRDEVLFECELNLEPDRLEWRFRSSNSTGIADDYLYLKKKDGYNISTYGGTSKLRVYVNQHSVGEYQCVAWFGASALASIPGRLTLAAISLDDKTDGSPSNGMMTRRILPSEVVHWRVHPNNSILMKCGDVVSNPAPVWSFFKDNSPVPTSVPQLSTGSLILQSITSNDSGIYYCSAVNSLTGNEIKLPQKIELLVESTTKSAPKFLVNPIQKYSVKPGATVILECPGVGNPIPKAVWSRPDADIFNNRTTVFSYGLQIVDAIPGDHGMYVCRLDNGITPALVHTMDLEVQELPSITDGPQTTLTNESESLELTCTALGHPTPTIYWLINGADTRWDPLIKSNGSVLVIKTVQKKHAGFVQCFAKNEVGEVNYSTLLQVKPKQISGESGQPLGTFPQTPRPINTTRKPPKRKKHKQHTMIPPSRPSVTRLSDSKVMVRWTVPTKEGLPIVFFKVQYRMIGDAAKKKNRNNWMTETEDIPPEVRMYELDGLKADHYYRFRIAAVYSNNDNKLSNVSTKFLLQCGSKLGPIKSHLIKPNLTQVEAISKTAIALHWLFPSKPVSPVDGFYAYYRKASTASEYMKATIDGMQTRRFVINHLEPGTAYEFKLQSFTASAASDFTPVITGKTLKPSTPVPTSSNIENKPTVNTSKSYLPLIAGAAGGGSLLLLATILTCFCMKRKNADRDDDANENKSHPDHIQAEPNGFSGTNGRVLGSPIHKSSRLNGVVPRMNITSNPLAQDGDKNRNVMELRFLPVAAVQQNNNHSQPTDVQHRRTLERSTRNLQYAGPANADGTNKTLHNDNGSGGINVSSMRRTRRTSGPGSPRVVRGVSSELLHNRSPMPVRAHTSKRNRLGSRTENVSSGSLNSIEV